MSLRTARRAVSAAEIEELQLFLSKLYVRSVVKFLLLFELGYYNALNSKYSFSMLFWALQNDSYAVHF
ncbi:hypothetical protein AGMMS49936_08190 [Endomicrobiia bacterium]|nr:hypothetical protein AGMMS49936_08190 [Endomicrobiia bacterium]